MEYMQIENNNYSSEEISLKDLLLKVKDLFVIVKSKWKFFLIAGLIGGILGMFFAIYYKPTYKAVLTFAMEEEKGGGSSGLSGALGLASSFGIDLNGSSGGGAFAASNLTELMKSKLIVEKVLLEPIIINGKTTTLIDYYIEFTGLKNEWAKNPLLNKVKFIPNSDRSKFSLQQDSIIKQIYLKLIDKNNLNILQKDKKVTILTLEVNSENEFFSKTFCENIAKQTSNFYIETKSKKARINADVLQKQVDSVRRELYNAISGVAVETDNVYNLNPAFNSKGAPSKKKQIDVQANTAVLTNLVVQLELAKITLRKETPLIQLIDTPSFPLEKNKFGILKSIIFGFFLTVLITIFYSVIRQGFKNLLT